jgi:hypothetical protein
VKFTNSEDRLNPVAAKGTDESTLGGYPAVHGRAPAFEGIDGLAYTAAIEAEPAEDGDGWVAYLIFLRWAAEGSAIMGHLETPDLTRGATRAEAVSRLEATPLIQVKALLDDTITMKREWEYGSQRARPDESGPVGDENFDGGE